MKYMLPLVLLAAVVLYLRWPQPDAAWTGRPAPEAPRQTEAGLPAPWERGDTTFRPLAAFSLRAIALGRETYRLDREASLAPVDFAFGWGPMSEAATVNAVSIAQSGRWYRWRSDADCPTPPDVIAASSANMHLIPANDAVRRAIFAARTHDLVELEGFLVEVAARDGWSWRSSLSRTDTGGGACEVVWVTRFEARKP